MLADGGRLGLLVFVADGPLPPPLPEGNEFPSEAELRGLLAGAGFTLEATADADLGDSPAEWTERADAVEAESPAGTATIPRSGRRRRTRGGSAGCWRTAACGPGWGRRPHA